MGVIVTIIVPCFNEEEVIVATCSRLSDMARGVDWNAEFLFVNDGSRDRTLELLREQCALDTRFKIVSFSRNFGHQSAVSAGLKYASGDAAVIIDADLQDPPELIPEMVKKWQDGEGDIVFGQRTVRKGESVFKRVSAKLFYRILNRLADTSIPNDTGDFRLVDRKVVDAFNNLPERNKYIRGLFPWLGFKSVPIEYERDPRLAGETKYPLTKMIRFASDGFLSFSRKPLKLATGFGIANIIISLALVVCVFAAYFSGWIAAVPGWIAILLIVIFFSGVQLLCIGVLGSYIGRIFDEVKGRPEFVVDETLGLE